MSIDPYTFATSPALLVSIPQSGTPISSEKFDQDDSILGGERDIELTVQSGAPGLVLTAGASHGNFTVSTPLGATGVTVIQYDGLDTSSLLESAVGLGGIDLTTGGAVGFHIRAHSDHPSQVTVIVVDSEDVSSSVVKNVPGGNLDVDLLFDFDLFADNVDIRSINAIMLVIQSFENVDFSMQHFSTYRLVVPVHCFSGTVQPCETNYYRLIAFRNLEIGQYLVIQYNSTLTPGSGNDTTRFYVLPSKYEDLQMELATNWNIKDTFGELPGPKLYDYVCDGTCDLEIAAYNLQNNATYYFAVEGTGDVATSYSVCTALREVPVYPIQDGVGYPVFKDHRADYPPADRVHRYRFYQISIPESQFSPGTYLSVNISRVEPFPGLTLRVMYDALPESAFDAGVLDAIDFNSTGLRSDEMVFPYCVNRTRAEDQAYFEHPSSAEPRVPCECMTQIEVLGNGPTFQLTCGVVVDPCQFKYGNWFISVELPERDFPENPADLSGRANYTLEAFVVQPAVYAVSRNVTYHGYVSPEAASHYSVDVPASTMVAGETHMLVHVSNVRNGFVTVHVRKGEGVGRNLAGREGCSSSAPAAFCRTSDACNLVVEKCHFSPGTWFISVEVSYDAEQSLFEVFDHTRMPMGYSIRATWMEDPAPLKLTAGVPVTRHVGEALYDFYVLQVPPTVDTWLFVELYTRAQDTEVTLSILHGALPGHECYATPDFYCLTGDPQSASQWADGVDPSHYGVGPSSRESCSFMIQTCELQAGPLYFSVYGHHKGYARYGDTTYYQVPVYYTLWVDFDVALALQSGVSLSEVVYEEQYQHYYIRADQSHWGSWISVELSNIRHAQAQSVQAYVNYQYLAGDCPCYENLYNCTGSTACGNVPNDPVFDCCTITVPASDFRPGVWYISVLGVTEDPSQFTTPIGYTLTVTIHDPPGFYPLLLGQSHAGQVPQWTKTHEYTQFRLGASPVPLNNLIFKLTYVQNCEFLGGHDGAPEMDSLVLYVNKHAPANELGYDYFCRASIESESYCLIVVPHCEWDSDRFFLSVQGLFDSTFDGRFTLQAFTDEVRDIALTLGVPYYDRVSYGRYKHFFVHYSGEEDEFLAIDIYTNSDQDRLTAYVNKDTRAGAAPCFEAIASCELETMCSWDLRACEISRGRYYVSVYGSHEQFYDISVEFTITASIAPVSLTLDSGVPLTSHLWKAGDMVHYAILVPEDFSRGVDVLFKIENIKHGAVRVYGQEGHLAGRCPCFISEYQSDVVGRATEEAPTRRDWAEIRIPTCRVKAGKYFFSVVAVENLTPLPTPMYNTPIGFTVEATIQNQLVLNPSVGVGRDVSKTEIFQFISDHRYNHYEFELDDGDVWNGYHVTVEITDVRDGSLFVYYNPGYPGDASCHEAQLCQGGLSSGQDCYWQIPFCTTSAWGKRHHDERRHYITVEGVTGQIEASYNILIYKENVPSINDNPAFTLDQNVGSGVFGFGMELNSTHDKLHEPYGWTQFIRLLNVDHHDDTERGEMLEIFFYRIANNPGESLDFDVYVRPKEPAGAHECCAPNELGFCKGAPCLSSVDVTTSVNNGPDRATHRCAFEQAGIGHDGEGVFFGQRCTVRVWPCEFEKYCHNVEDWFVTVVPVATMDPDSNGVGLTYSTQWRTRNIRQLEYGDIGSQDLTGYVNAHDWTPTFGVRSLTTEDQGWRSFYVDWASSHGRLSIQTEFFPSSDGAAGVVYIHGGEFAAPHSACNDYECYSRDGETPASIDCAVGGRFIVTEGCSSAHERYYITVRNTGRVGSVLDVAFRLVAYDLHSHDSGVQSAWNIPPHVSASAPFVSSNLQSPFPGVTGVQGENYHVYRMTLDDEDLEQNRHWVIAVERDPSDLNQGPLEVFLRYGAEGGNFGPTASQAYYGNEPEGAHTYWHRCSLGTNPLDGGDVETPVCVWTIPPCALIRGHYYISIWNPLFDFEDRPQDLPDYRLTTYLTDPPRSLELNQVVSYTPDLTGGLNQLFDVGQYYQVTVTPNHLNVYPRERTQGTYWTRYLRIQLDLSQEDSLNSGSELFVSYGGLPRTSSTTETGGGNQEIGCLANADLLEHSCAGTCFVDMLPCSLDGAKLRSGVYYVHVRQATRANYNLVATINSRTYQELSYDGARESAPHRGRVLDESWSWTASPQELSSLGGDGNGHFFYMVDVAGQTGGSDDLDDLHYYYANFTATSSGSPSASLELEMWRDDCSRWTCPISSAQRGAWCVVDALGLAPCSAKAGRYYFRVSNPEAVPFRLSFHRNQSRVQTLENRQVLHDVAFPYEYQQYFFTPQEVGQGATLTVRVCSTCGEVQAFLRADLPAGPSSAHPGQQCALDSCAVIGQPEVPGQNHESCCTMFLDACELQQRGYYIGIRGVSAEFPNEDASRLYLPARYSVQATQTLVNFTESAPSCPTLIEYSESWNEVPRQYVVDIETLQVGTQLRFSYRLSSEFPAEQQTQATSLWVNLGHAVGFTDACGHLGDAYRCEIAPGSRSCSFVVPYCELHKLSAGRFYLRTDGPRGSEILVERWDPTIPVIHTDREYHGTLNQDVAPVHWDLPFAPGVQYYRFDLDPQRDEDYYKRFFVRVAIRGVAHGSVGAAVNSGYYPHADGGPCTWEKAPLFLDDYSCAQVSEGEECYIEISYADLMARVSRDEFVTRPPTAFWLAVWGVEQLCELHAIKYSFKVQTRWEMTYFPIGSSHCNSVSLDEYNLHRLRPHAPESPQESIVRFEISDIKDPETQRLRLLVQDQHLATLSNYAASVSSNGESGFVYDHICGYESLYASIYGEQSANIHQEIDYRMTVNKIKVPVKILSDDSTYHADDDDGDACPHEHDFYIFRTARPYGHHAGSFFRVAVDSEFPTRVYVNKDTFAWEGCHDSGYGENDPSVTGTTTVNVYDFCDFQDGVYYITVVSGGPYYIFTHIRDDVQTLQLGESIAGRPLQAGEYQMYQLEVCKDWYKPDDRLVVALSDVQGGDVTAWIRRGGNPGMRTTSDGSSSCADDSAFASFAPGHTGYDFVLVDSYHLEPGTYFILVRANGDLPGGARSEASRVCSRVSYRLFAYLEDLEVKLLSLRPNYMVQDAVDYYAINRYESAALQTTNFYELRGILMERDGFHQQVSHAVARLMHVRGGLLQLSVARGHLALPREGYVAGESHALTKSQRVSTAFQSGRRPFTKQTLVDARESPFSMCDDGSDYCCQMTRGDGHGDELARDSSCSVWLPSCYLMWTQYYLAVTALEQDSEDQPITYGLLVHQTRDFVLIQPNTHRTASFKNNDWDHHFYYSLSSQPQSMRWRVVVTGGEGVLVTVRNHRCPLQADWERQVWCDADSFDRPWLCDVEIQTRAAHPGDNAFFVEVQGRNASYSIAFWRGRENCHAFSRQGRPEGLNFCAGLVPYATWRWDNYRTLDREAQCFFEQLYSHFAVQPCWSGVSVACNSSLQEFACHESFRGCDEHGFSVGTCRDSCESVVYECVNWFESVDLEHYNCSSHRYLDSRVESCTGGKSFQRFDPESGLFLGDEPNLLLWKSSTSSSSSLVFSFVVTLLALFFVL